MIRKVLSYVFAVALLVSCGNADKKGTVSKTDDQTGAVKVEFASLIENPENYIGKEISVEGKVVHVCKHSGKKLFITGENPDIRLFISAGEEVAKFPMELLGSEIVVEGILTKAQAEGMGTGQGNHAEGDEHNAPSDDECETEQAVAAQPVLAELMMVYNKHTLVK